MSKRHRTETDQTLRCATPSCEATCVVRKGTEDTWTSVTDQGWHITRGRGSIDEDGSSTPFKITECFCPLHREGR